MRWIFKCIPSLKHPPVSHQISVSEGNVHTHIPCHISDPVDLKRFTIFLCGFVSDIVHFMDIARERDMRTSLRITGLMNFIHHLEF
jgi:hypothetical protein